MTHAAYRMEWAIDQPIALPKYPILIEKILGWSLNEDAKMLGSALADLEALMPLKRIEQGGIKRWMASALQFSRDAVDTDAPKVEATGGTGERVGFVRGWFVGDAVEVERLITRVAHVGDIGDWHLGTHLTCIVPDRTAVDRWREQGTAEGHEALGAAMRQAMAQSATMCG